MDTDKSQKDGRCQGLVMILHGKRGDLEVQYLTAEPMQKNTAGKIGQNK